MADGEQSDPSLTGSEWGNRLRRGEWPALEAVYCAMVREVWRFALGRLGGDRHAADEVTSQVFLSVVENASQFNPQRATIEGWVFGIARHKVADHLRKAYRERRRHAMLERDADAPVARASEHDAADALHAALDRIEPRQREVLLWKYRDGLTTRQIAARVRRSEKACEHLLARARERFKMLYTQVTR